MNKKTYLADGVYAELDFGDVRLSTDRAGGEHFIVLDDTCIFALMKFLESVYPVKITIEKREEEE